MKIICYPLFIFIFICCCCEGTKYSDTKRNVPDNPVSQSVDNTSRTTDFSEQTTWILGYFKKDRFLRPPHSEWFLKGYDDYQVNAEVVNKLLSISKEGLDIKIVMGSWCPDSRREVPRFMRIIDIWKFSEEKITFIGVDNAKISPVGEFEKLGIQRVPTFIIYKNNIEAGRIIENPKTSLEQDLVNILTQE